MKRWLKILLLSVGIVAAIAAVIFFWFINQINHQYSGTVMQFEIESGESSKDVIHHLYVSNVIKSELSALVYVKLNHPKILAGTFTIPQNYSIKSLFNIFASPDLKQQKLTVTEGWAKEQIADALVQFGLSREVFLGLAKNYEGKLFPDTYFVGGKSTEQSLFKAMTEQYQKKTSDLNVTEDQLILASIVEREALTDTDRGIIAGIYSNRLKVGMPLGADPTVQYAKYIDLGLAPTVNGQKQYWAAITTADYKNAVSAYNTFLHTGLPPAPICNPGLASIKAAQNPTDSEDYYFFYDSKDQLITAKTLTERNALLQTHPI